MRRECEFQTGRGPCGKPSVGDIPSMFGTRMFLCAEHYDHFADDLGYDETPRAASKSGTFAKMYGSGS